MMHTHYFVGCCIVLIYVLSHVTFRTHPFYDSLILSTLSMMSSSSRDRKDTKKRDSRSRSRSDSRSRSRSAEKDKDR